MSEREPWSIIGEPPPDLPYCPVCDGTGVVCENHPDCPWDGHSDREDACGCGAGMPCPRGCKHYIDPGSVICSVGDGES
jgi:hypothetical protein